MFGPSRRILCIASHGCDCYLSSGRKLILEARFAPDQADDFTGFIRSRRGSVFIALADQLEEDFRQDSMPFLRGPARSQLLARKAAQVYRDTPFHSSASLGRDADGRRDERVQLMALTNAEALNEWLTPLSAAGIRISGLYSPPVVAPQLLRLIARRTGPRPRQLLLVTLGRAGLRQTLVDGDVARFSRLAAIADGEPAEFAANCLTEVNKTQQYLVSLRLLPRDSKLAVLLIVPPGQLQAWSRSGLLVDAVEPVFVDLEDARHAAGLKSIRAAGEAEVQPEFADTLWIHVAGATRPRIDFAPTWLRETYQLWRARVAVWLAGAAVMLGGAAVGVERWTGSLTLAADTAQLAAQTRHNEQNYVRIKRGFPPLPATPEQLRASVTAFEKLAARTATPSALMAAIGQILESNPEFRLDKLDWQLAATDSVGPAAPAVESAQTGANADARAPLYEIATLEGSIVVANRAADLRRDIADAEQIAERLSAISGARVTVTRLPVDLSPRATLHEESAASRTRNIEAAGFAIRVSRKVGT